MTEPKRRIPISALLAFGFGGLMLLAVGSVLSMSVMGARQNNRSLLSDRVEGRTLMAIERVRAQLDPVQSQVEYLARLFEERQADIEDEDQMTRLLFGAVAATPQVFGMAVVRPNLSALRIERDSGAIVRESWADRSEIADLMSNLTAQSVTRWHGPAWSPAMGHTLLTMVVPLTASGRIIGMLVPEITVADVSRYLATLRRDTGQLVFVLLDEEHVIAHPGLADDAPATGPLRPLPTVDEVGDPILARAFRAPRRPMSAVGDLPYSHGHIIDMPDDFYIVIYRREALYGTQSWIVGTYAPGAEVGAEVRRVQAIAVIGGAMLVLAVALTVWVGRRISRPIGRLAHAARQVEGLEFQTVDRLPSSRVREIDEAARAFNAMAAGLAWFETYLPRTLVRQLVQRGNRHEVVSEEREITVMFTDIVDSSSFARRLSRLALAEFLNHHFALVGGSVDKSGGTIDKYTGDGVMAFWGAPIEQPNHARRACRAARRIAARIAADNRARRQAGLPIVRVRVGIHTGMALVGNIGAPGRINYTPLGEAVILAERIQRAAKNVDRGDEVTVLISEATRTALGGSFPCEGVGTHRLDGRADTTALYRLVFRPSL